jgi:hypothetical protein
MHLNIITSQKDTISEYGFAKTKFDSSTDASGMQGGASPEPECFVV